MTGIIVSLPPTVESPPGNNGSNPSSLPGITYKYAILSLPQTWTAVQTYYPNMLVLSGTGGTGQYVKQSSFGGPLTAGPIQATDIPASALSGVNDTNVTLTLGGSPTSALLAATSITLGWSGTLASARGGFGADVSAQSGVPLFATGIPTFTGTTGSGNFVRATSSTLVTPALGTPSSGILANCSGLPVSTGVSGLGTGIAAALAVNTGSAGAPVLFNGAGGTPSSLTLTNAAGLVPSTGLSATGSPSSSTYLRGDNTWASVNSSPVFTTRSVAAALDLSAFTSIRTLGYSSDGDNGGAVFKKVGSTVAFIDTYPLTVTITGGSGYTNGTYRGIQMNATSGRNLTATVTVSGGAVTALDFSACPGNAYKVGETITAPNTQIGGTGSGFSATIATISTPTASFVDAGGNRWQYVVDVGGKPRVEQFGAVGDWTGADAGATDNFTAFQNALFFAGRQLSGLSSDTGPAGDVLMCGYGAYKIKLPSAGKSLIVPFGVILEGVSGSVLKIDSTSDAGTHFITLGDPNSHLACFRSRLKNLSLLENTTGASSGTAMVFSNNVQDMGGLEDVYIYSKDRGGVLLTNGYGGASTVRLWNVSINWNSATNPGVSINYGTTIVNIHDMITGGPSSGSVAAVALLLSGTTAMYKVEGLHVENATTGIQMNVTSGGMCKVVNATGGPGVTNLVVLLSTNSAGNFSIEESAKNGATTLVSNGQSGGTSRTADVLPKDGIVFFNP